MKEWQIPNFGVFKKVFVYFERERERAHMCACVHLNKGGAERERETQNLKQAPGSELSA